MPLNDAMAVQPPGRELPPRPERILLWIFMIVGIGAAGVAFAYKVAEFIFTLESDDAQGFADVPVTVYFAVAAGWLCLLCWCFLRGDFTDVERSKYEMLEMEAAHERRGE